MKFNKQSSMDTMRFCSKRGGIGIYISFNLFILTPPIIPLTFDLKIDANIGDCKKK